MTIAKLVSVLSRFPAECQGWPVVVTVPEGFKEVTRLSRREITVEASDPAADDTTLRVLVLGD